MLEHAEDVCQDRYSFVIVSGEDNVLGLVKMGRANGAL